MKDTIRHLIQQALTRLTAEGVLPEGLSPAIQVENTKDKSHGDFASNIAMMLAKPAGQKPRDLAEKLIAALPEHLTEGGTAQLLRQHFNTRILPPVRCGNGEIVSSSRIRSLRRSGLAAAAAALENWKDIVTAPRAIRSRLAQFEVANQ